MSIWSFFWDGNPLQRAWRRFCLWVVLVFVVSPVAAWLWVRDLHRAWFRPIWVEGTGIKWVLEDGRVLTHEDFLLLCAERGGDRWFFDERTHWNVYWRDGHRVSTVWLGLDHSFTMDGLARPARCWETCVFGPYGASNGVTDRYITKWAALKGHLKMVATVQFYRLKAALRREPRLKLQTESGDDE